MPIVRVHRVWLLDGIDELDDGVTVGFVECTKLLYGGAGIGLGTAMPHDSLHGAPCAAVVQTVFCASDNL